MSLSVRNDAPPHFLHVVPGGMSSSGGRANQASEPSRAKMSAA